MFLPPFQALSAVQIVLAITFCCQSGKASHCFFAFFVLEEVVLYLTLGVAGLFKLSSGRPQAADVIAGGAGTAQRDVNAVFSRRRLRGRVKGNCAFTLAALAT